MGHYLHPQSISILIHTPTSISNCLFFSLFGHQRWQSIPGALISGGTPTLGWDDTLKFLTIPLILWCSQTISTKVELSYYFLYMLLSTYLCECIAIFLYACEFFISTNLLFNYLSFPCRLSGLDTSSGSQQSHDRTRTILYWTS